MHVLPYFWDFYRSVSFGGVLYSSVAAAAAFATVFVTKPYF